MVLGSCGRLDALLVGLYRKQWLELVPDGDEWILTVKEGRRVGGEGFTVYVARGGGQVIFFLSLNYRILLLIC